VVTQNRCLAREGANHLASFRAGQKKEAMINTPIKFRGKSKLLIIPVCLCLIALLIITSCSTAPTAPPDLASTEYSQPTQINKTIEVPMCGVHIESFDFNKGESIAGRFTVVVKYPVSLSIGYYEEIRTYIEPGSGTEVVETAAVNIFTVENELSGTFTFVAPKTAEYKFWFWGQDIDELNWLDEEVTLELTVHPSR